MPEDECIKMTDGPATMPKDEDIEMNEGYEVISSRFQECCIGCRIFLKKNKKPILIVLAVALVGILSIIIARIPSFFGNAEQIVTPDHTKVYCINATTWSNEIAYHIYVPAFKDANGDGHGRGSVQGIREMLSYFKQLNISILWISSLQKAQDNDDDIITFTDTDLNLAYYDSESDWLREFLYEAQKKGIKVIMDITINHSSVSHKWFSASKNNETRYKDYYIWHQGRMDGQQREPPNSWISVDGKSAWTWDDTRQAYYFHRFEKSKPDLNLENADVLEEMKTTVRYWLGKGFSGFYIRDFPYLVERIKEKNGQNSSEDIGENMKILKMFQEVIRDWKATNNVTGNMVLLFSSTEKETSVKKMEGISVGLVNDVLYQIKQDLQGATLQKVIEETLSLTQKKNVFPVWVLGDEMKSRIATKFSPESAALLQQLELLLPGLSVIHYGEEIGMTDLPKNISHCQNGGIHEVREKDRFRTPMQWNGNRHAGFSYGASVCPPVNENFKEINVELQKGNNSSLWRRIKDLIFLKAYTQTSQKTEIKFPLDVDDKELFGFAWNGVNASAAYLFIMNTGKNSKKVTLEIFGEGFKNATQFKKLKHYGTPNLTEAVDMASGIIIPPHNVVLLTFQFS